MPQDPRFSCLSHKYTIECTSCFINYLQEVNWKVEEIAKISEDIFTNCAHGERFDKNF